MQDAAHFSDLGIKECPERWLASRGGDVEEAREGIPDLGAEEGICVLNLGTAQQSTALGPRDVQKGQKGLIFWLPISWVRQFSVCTEHPDCG